MKKNLLLSKIQGFWILLFVLGFMFVISCKKEKQEKDKIGRIELSAPQSTVKRFLELQLIAKAYYVSGDLVENINFQWQTSNETIATVDANGKLKARKVGQVEISASYNGVVGKYSVEVTPNAIQAISLSEMKDTLVVAHYNTLSAKARLASGDEIDIGELMNWSLSNMDLAEITSDGLLGKTQGNLLVTANFEGMSGTKAVFVNAVEVTEISNFLSTPISGALNVLPVVIIRSLATADGINIDVSKSPGYWNLDPISLADMKSKIDNFDIYTKFALEEATKFRGYKDPNAVPYIGYKVVGYITLYEQLPNSYIPIGQDSGQDMYMPDYTALFNRLNIEHYVNDLGVKEIWMWNGGVAPSYPCYDPNIHGTDSFLKLWESNMSSALTGDISNSDRRNDDLPIYNHTYVLYSHNIRRTQAEAIHNRGHQFESIFAHVNSMQDGNSDLFWKKFTGQDSEGHAVTGRCGNTHMPPNTTTDYDYENTALVQSDIEDWKPDNSGVKKNVNVNTWKNIAYGWPADAPSSFDQKTETQFYIYWMQSFPGNQNTIPYGNGKTMTNWWKFVTDWEDAINSNMGLHTN